jgi:hypothetical protein
MRGGLQPLAPDWAIPTGEVIARTSDRWLRRLLYVGAGTLTVALVLYVVYLIILRSGSALA